MGGGGEPAGASNPRGARRKRWPFVRRLQRIQVSEKNYLFCPLSILERTSSGREKTMSHCQHPFIVSPASSYSSSLETRKARRRGDQRAPVYSARRLGSPNSGQYLDPASRTPHPWGEHMVFSGPYGLRKYPSKGDSYTSQALRRALTSPALSFQTCVVAEPNEM